MVRELGSHTVCSIQYTLYSIQCTELHNLANGLCRGLHCGPYSGVFSTLAKTPSPPKFQPLWQPEGGWGGFRETKVTQDQLVFISRNKSGPRSWDTLAPPACGFLSWVTLWVTLWVTPLAYRSLASFNWRYGVQKVLLDIT